MPNTRKNNKKIWKGSGGPYDTDATKSSTGDSSRSTTPSVFSKFLKYSSSDSPLNPPTRLNPNSEHNISADNKRQIIDPNNDDKRHKINPNNATMEKKRVDTAIRHKDNLKPKGLFYDHTGEWGISNDNFIHDDSSSHFAVNKQLQQRYPQDNRGGKSRRKSKKSKKRTRKTKRKSRR